MMNLKKKLKKKGGGSKIGYLWLFYAVNNDLREEDAKRYVSYTPNLHNCDKATKLEGLYRKTRNTY